MFTPDWFFAVAAVMFVVLLLVFLAAALLRDLDAPLRDGRLDAWERDQEEGL